LISSLRKFAGKFAALTIKIQFPYLTLISPKFPGASGMTYAQDASQAGVWKARSIDQFD
jgi:hypothetical protein